MASHEHANNAYILTHWLHKSTFLQDLAFIQPLIQHTKLAVSKQEGGRHDSVVRAVTTGAEGSSWSIFQKPSVSTQHKIGTSLFSELGKVKALKKKSGAHVSYTIARTNWLSNSYYPIQSLAVGTTF